MRCGRELAEAADDRKCCSDDDPDSEHQADQLPPTTADEQDHGEGSKQRLHQDGQTQHQCVPSPPFPVERPEHHHGGGCQQSRGVLNPEPVDNGVAPQHSYRGEGACDKPQAASHCQVARAAQHGGDERGLEVSLHDHDGVIRRDLRDKRPQEGVGWWVGEPPIEVGGVTGGETDAVVVLPLGVLPHLGVPKLAMGGQDDLDDHDDEDRCADEKGDILPPSLVDPRHATIVGDPNA